MEQPRLINTEKSLSKNEIITLNEKFIQSYCKSKNWDLNNLSPSQLLEITTHSEYKRVKK